MDTILRVANLTSVFDTKAGEVQAVRGVSFVLNRGEILGIVGESGSGKSVSALSILRALAANGRITEGRIFFKGQDLQALPRREFRRIRGNKISMVFQDPMSSLNPLMFAGRQIEEAIREHYPSLPKSAAKERTLALLRQVRIPNPELCYRVYPHELSGGMRQRVMIAMALSCEPELLIADEPTTALDVTIQDQIIMLLKEMRRELNLSVIFITHDLGVVAEICDRVLVMYGGLIMEEGLVEDIFYRSAHPYTMGLLDSIPRLNQTKEEQLKPIRGSPPNMLRVPGGCPFSPRCKWARRLCLDERPPRVELSADHTSSCWLLAGEAPAEANPLAELRGGRG
jgi:oligopeptide transport system ATP-binding protein